MKRVVRGVVLLATSALVVCGVKGPPRPPAETDAGAAGPPSLPKGEPSSAPADGAASADGAAAADGGRP